MGWPDGCVKQGGMHMQIETLTLWDDREDVTLTTFVSKTPEIMPMPLMRPQ